MGLRNRLSRSSSKSPPILSHEFIIQNHADIISCIAMCFVLCLLFQSTNAFGQLFVVLQHNQTALNGIH